MLKEHPVFIPGPCGQLEAYFVQDPSHSTVHHAMHPVGVVCHPHPLHQGSMQNKVVTTITKAWQQMGVATLRFNFRGVGLSEGNYDEGIGEQEDLRAVLDWVLKNQPSSHLFLAGFSFGAFISSKIAGLNEYPLTALLSVAPPLRYFSFTEAHLSTEAHLPKAPWIIIQGENDELIPYQDVLDWYQRIKSKKQNVYLIGFKETTHFFHGKLIELKQEIIQSMKPYLM